MTYISIRMLWFFVVVAAILNFSSYTLKKFYNTDGKRVSKYYYPKTESGMETPRSLAYSEETLKAFGSDCISDVTSTKNPQQIIYYNKTGINATDFNVLPVLDDCPELPPGLGETYMPSKVMDMKQFEENYGEIKVGGIYKPSNCQALQSVAVIIAFRGCQKSLTTFLTLLHPFLIKQQSEYQIFVLEQSNNSQHFNRGLLLNVGFVEAQKRRKNGWGCIVLHEPHIVPTDSRNLYRCSWYPRQLAVHVERPSRSAYVPKFGGAVALTPQQFWKVNGFSNKYWGNDADLEDLYNRLFHANYYVENSQLGRYKTLDQYSGPVRVKSEYIPTPSPLYLLDGLTSLVYKVETAEAKRMYTHIKVNIDEPNDTESHRMYNKLLNPTTTLQIHATFVTTNTIDK